MKPLDNESLSSTMRKANKQYYQEERRNNSCSYRPFWYSLPSQSSLSLISKMNYPAYELWFEKNSLKQQDLLAKKTKGWNKLIL